MDYASLWWMVILFVAFVGIVLWVYRSRAKKQYEEMGKIPLERDGEE